MKFIYLVSTYKGHDFDQDVVFERFSFYGAYYGNLINKILLRPSNKLSLELDRKYLLKIKVLNLEHGVLYGEILKLKKLPDEHNVFELNQG